MGVLYLHSLALTMSAKNSLIQYWSLQGALSTAERAHRPLTSSESLFSKQQDQFPVTKVSRGSRVRGYSSNCSSQLCTQRNQHIIAHTWLWSGSETDFTPSGFQSLYLGVGTSKPTGNNLHLFLCNEFWGNLIEKILYILRCSTSEMLLAVHLTMNHMAPRLGPMDCARDAWAPCQQWQTNRCLCVVC